jgi:Domain of unknown function (DUF4347)
MISLCEVLIYLSIVDSKVENYQQLVSGVKAGTEVILLDSTRDGIEQIAAILSDRQNINSLQIVSHGKAASVELGSTGLNASHVMS